MEGGVAAGAEQETAPDVRTLQCVRPLSMRAQRNASAWAMQELCRRSEKPSNIASSA